MHIALIGFMGSGKTSIGYRLSQMLGCQFIDLDEQIEKAAHAPIAKIFDGYGEEAFRRMESEELATVARAQDEDDLVLACGGGVVEARLNRRILKKDFLTVWIDVPLAEIARRLSKESGSRPLWSGSDTSLYEKRLYEKRTALYSECASIVYRWQEAEDENASVVHIYELLKKALQHTR